MIKYGSTNIGFLYLKMYNFYTIPVATVALMQLHVRETGLYVLLNTSYFWITDQLIE